MADIFAVVADGTRRHLLEVLRERYTDPAVGNGEASVGELVERLGLSQPTVSKHLRVLREHGLVSVREEGQHRYYRMDAAPLVPLEEWLVPFLAASVVVADEGAQQTVDPDVVAAVAESDLGSRIGRLVAERSHGARAALAGAQKRVGKGIRRTPRG